MRSKARGANRREISGALAPRHSRRTLHPPRRCLPCRPPPAPAPLPMGGRRALLPREDRSGLARGFISVMVVLSFDTCETPENPPSSSCPHELSLDKNISLVNYEDTYVISVDPSIKLGVFKKLIFETIETLNIEDIDDYDLYSSLEPDNKLTNMNAQLFLSSRSYNNAIFDTNSLYEIYLKKKAENNFSPNLGKIEKEKLASENYGDGLNIIDIKPKTNKQYNNIFFQREPFLDLSKKKNYGIIFLFVMKLILMMVSKVNTFIVLMIYVREIFL